jgi:hypothetical protein
MIRTFGIWAGDSKGRKEDPKRCIKPVVQPGDYISYQCARRRRPVAIQRWRP